MNTGRRHLIAPAVMLLGVLLGPSNAFAGSNDTMETAQGPVTSHIDGAIQTENDVDWFFFYAGGSTQLDIALTGVGPEESCSRWYAELRDQNGGYLSEARAEFNQVDHILYTVSSPGKYYLQVSGGYCEAVGYYRIDISASPPLLNEPPYIPPPAAGPSPGSSASCRQARTRVSSLNRRLRYARSRRQRNRLRAKLRRARNEARRYC